MMLPSSGKIRCCKTIISTVFQPCMPQQKRTITLLTCCQSTLEYIPKQNNISADIETVESSSNWTHWYYYLNWFPVWLCTLKANYYSLSEGKRKTAKINEKTFLPNEFWKFCKGYMISLTLQKSSKGLTGFLLMHCFLLFWRYHTVL